MPTIEFNTGNQLPMSSIKYNANIIILSSISFANIFTAIMETEMMMKERIAPNG
jgi:phosphotransacetylase